MTVRVFERRGLVVTHSGVARYYLGRVTNIPYSQTDSVKPCEAMAAPPGERDCQAWQAVECDAVARICDGANAGAAPRPPCHLERALVAPPGSFVFEREQRRPGVVPLCMRWRTAGIRVVMLFFVCTCSQGASPCPISLGLGWLCCSLPLIYRRPTPLPSVHARHAPRPHPCT